MGFRRRGKESEEERASGALEVNYSTAYLVERTQQEADLEIG